MAGLGILTSKGRSLRGRHHGCNACVCIPRVLQLAYLANNDDVRIAKVQADKLAKQVCPPVDSALVSLAEADPTADSGAAAAFLKLAKIMCFKECLLHA